ncbi:phosphatidylinositol 5-phosphate 4-kinase isoform a [Anaeramoeba ignava]|uniref:Phosphatidylinositol 5-phosphate 4-kinase isoform a n=1 Tax=Anaeramoeba ignava TaxID=1746090 RepID=A0A9Q0LVF4_ANAIG|nr:phosphatidylinositol 5-phosphate 4-kinase isoform a [Anaeramoeba ignava]
MNQNQSFQNKHELSPFLLNIDLNEDFSKYNPKLEENQNQNTNSNININSNSNQTQNQEKNQQIIFAQVARKIYKEIFNSILLDTSKITEILIDEQFLFLMENEKTQFKMQRLINDLPTLGKLFEQNILLRKDQMKFHKLVQREIDGILKIGMNKENVSQFLEIAEELHSSKLRINEELNYIYDFIDEIISNHIPENKYSISQNSQNLQNSIYDKISQTQFISDNLGKSFINSIAFQGSLTAGKSTSKFLSKIKFQNFLKIGLITGIEETGKILKLMEKRKKEDFKKINLNQKSVKIKIEKESYHFFNEKNEYLPDYINFKEYHPFYFHQIRFNHHINYYKFMEGLCGDGKLPKHMQTGAGRSGALFFLSTNQAFVIKNISKPDSKILRRLTNLYFQHLKKNPESLLPGIYGHYKIEFGNSCEYFMIMNNVFQTNLEIDEKYDLKGSTVKRGGKSKTKVPEAVYKDNDLVDFIYLGEATKKKIISQIREDITFLQKQNIMDYSLLVGISFIDNKKIQDLQSQVSLFQQNHFLKSFFGGIRAISVDENGRECVYFLGLIDILQEYTITKKVERSLKAVRYLTVNQMSSINPKSYLKRFLKMVERRIK